MNGTLEAAKESLNKDVQRILGRYFGKDLKHVGKQELEPFLAILQSVKAAYKERPEVWHMLLQHLHDYVHYKDGFRLPKEKVVQYIDILLEDHPDYAECLVANLPNLKVPLIMANGKSDGSMASIDPGLLASKRQKCETSPAFYNFATPAVKAYLAAQGQPPRITRVAPHTNVVNVPTFTIVTPSSGSASSSSTISSPIVKKSSVMGNPQKLATPKPSTSASASPSHDPRLQAMMLNHQNRMMKLEYLQEEAKIKHLNQMEQNQLKLAIQRLQLQRKLAQAEHQKIPQDRTKHVRVQVCGTNPPVYKVMRAQDVLIDERVKEAVKTRVLPQTTDKVQADSPIKQEDNVDTMSIKKEPVTPPPSPLPVDTPTFPVVSDLVKLETMKQVDFSDSGK